MRGRNIQKSINRLNVDEEIKSAIRVLKIISKEISKKETVCSLFFLTFYKEQFRIFFKRIVFF